MGVAFVKHQQVVLQGALEERPRVASMCSPSGLPASVLLMAAPIPQCCPRLPEGGRRFSWEMQCETSQRNSNKLSCLKTSPSARCQTQVLKEETGLALRPGCRGELVEGECLAGRRGSCRHRVCTERGPRGALGLEGFY